MNIRIEMNKYPVLKVNGRIDTLTSSEFHVAIVKELESSEEKLVCDLTEVDYISSAGLRVFLIAQKKAKVINKTLLLAGMNEELCTVFDISGFTKFFNIVDTVDSALTL